MQNLSLPSILPDTSTIILHLLREEIRFRKLTRILDQAHIDIEIMLQIFPALRYRCVDLKIFLMNCFCGMLKRSIGTPRCQQKPMMLILKNLPLNFTSTFN
jgi:hypothetical protein